MAKVDRLMQLYDSVVAEINNLNYKGFSGIEIFFQFKFDSIHEPQPVLDQLNALLTNYSNLLLVAKRTIFTSEDEKSITMTRIYFLYYSKILWSVHANIASKMKEWIEVHHDDASIYLKRYFDLSNETIEYLSQKGLIKGDKAHFKAFTGNHNQIANG
ncbi:hypothetical protein [Paraflavitalea soli]|uniref:hypothetical protein n=1 Tax=Paraflavitalea soli TaxID=2315862 RepID=UPI0013C48C29|nr:hypothetical protein [Paraflavitalea soli]